MSSLSAEEANQLSAFLGNITDNTDLDALALVTREGMRLAFSAVEGTQINPDQFSAMSAVLLQAGFDTIQKLGFSTLLEVVLRGSSSFLVLASAGKFFLIGGSRAVRDLGKVVAVFRYYAKKIADSYPST
jgi:predicted regulator of Ras-like GTPase activity (Roadblock/LC7/MglB family)